MDLKIMKNNNFQFSVICAERDRANHVSTDITVICIDLQSPISIFMDRDQIAYTSIIFGSIPLYLTPRAASHQDGMQIPLLSMRYPGRNGENDSKLWLVSSCS